MPWLTGETEPSAALWKEHCENRRRMVVRQSRSSVLYTKAFIKILSDLRLPYYCPSIYSKPRLPSSRYE